MEEALRKQEEAAKEKLERSQASHRAQLDEALAQRVPSPPRETEHLKSQMGKICNRLRKALKDLDLQYFISEDLKVEFEQVKGEKEALKKEVEDQKMAVCKERKMLKVGKTNVELELENCLEMERAQAQEQQDKLSKMEEALRKQEEAAKEKLESSRAFLRAQLDEALAQRVPSPPRETEHLKSQMGKISNRLRKALKDLDLQYFINEDLKVELEQMKGEKEVLKKEVEDQKMELYKERQMLKVSQTNVELELESCLEMERAQAQELQDKLSKMEEALREQEEEKTILERSQAAHRAQLEMQDLNNKDLMAALEKKFEQQLESHLNEWKEDKSSLLQATESLKLTQQEKEQEWERTETTMRSQLEDLQSQMMQKQKRKKWYRKLLPG
ncbi:trichohyalin-like [Etheostoma cragini]|uniref:trichohyalin-like n=1 Tax=Etheostoma cragini TaxID=417921 RepID=UPI00155F18E3|nr:trichohyalin-like [Etheostoma cragini]